MLASFSPEKTSLIILLSIAMIVMAIVDFRYLKIHNVLTFPVIFAGWAFALINGWINGADIEMYLPTNYLGMEKCVMFELHGGEERGAGALALIWTLVPGPGSSCMALCHWRGWSRGCEDADGLWSLGGPNLWLGSRI